MWHCILPATATFLSCRVNRCRQRLDLFDRRRLLQFFELLFDFGAKRIANSAIWRLVKIVNTSGKTAFGCDESSGFTAKILRCQPKNHEPKSRANERDYSSTVPLTYWPSVSRADYDTFQLCMAHYLSLIIIEITYADLQYTSALIGFT